MQLIYDDTVAILDIGGFKISCLLCRSSHSGAFSVLSSACVASRGIDRGLVVDLQAFLRATLDVINIVEKTTGIRIKKAVLLISTNNLLAKRVSSQLTFSSNFLHEITHRDVNKVVFECANAISNDMHILHSLIYEYLVDGRTVSKPFGLLGHCLECKMHLIYCDKSVLSDIVNCLEKIGIEVYACISGLYAASSAVIERNKAHFDINMIEFGSDHTSIGIFRNDVLIYIDAIPIGARNVSNDLAQCLQIPLHIAEKIKNLFGSIRSDDLTINHEYIEVDGETVRIVNDLCQNQHITNERDSSHNSEVNPGKSVFSPGRYDEIVANLLNDVESIEGLQISERMKSNYTPTALTSSQVRRFPIFLVNQIICARIDETIQMLVDNLAKQPETFLASSTILTGGGAQIEGLATFLSGKFGHGVSLAPPPSGFINTNDVNYLGLVASYGAMTLLADISDNRESISGSKNISKFKLTSIFGRILDFFR